MKTLAKESKDRDVRAHLTRMAENWERRARANQRAEARAKKRSVKSAQSPKKRARQRSNCGALKHSREENGCPLEQPRMILPEDYDVTEASH
jgi:hypothetical protein